MVHSPFCPRGASRTGSTTRRLIYSLSLIPIVPAVSMIAAYHSDGWLTGSDSMRWFHLFFSMMWVALTILIWRKAIIWTLGRQWLTALVGMIPFVQVVYAQPLWDAGCIADDILRQGQNDVMVGFWIWMSIWLWWGWEKTAMTFEQKDGTVGVSGLSISARRVLASIGSIPVVFGVFLIIWVASDAFSTTLSPGAMLSFAYGGAAVFAVAAWHMIWYRGGTAWRAHRLGPLKLAAFLIFAPSLGPWLTSLAAPSPNDFLEAVVGTLPVIGWGLWMALSVTFWPPAATGGEGITATPTCMRCGYLLIGLRSTRCPECGDEPTIDELWQATAGEPEG